MSGQVTLTITSPIPGDAYTFDVLTVTRDPSQSATRHPVEVGVDVTDHVQREPDPYVLQVRVTNTPLVDVAPIPGQLSPVRQAEAFLERASTSLLTMTLRGYPPVFPVVLEGWGSQQGPEEARTFRLRLQTIRIARSLSVRIPAGNTSSVGGPGTQDLGPQSAQDRGASAFIRGLDWVRGGPTP
ncbi:MAG: phage baseplate protein [Myxococcota bacterium]